MVIIEEATLIVSNVLPSTIETLADAPLPFESALSNITLSPTLYPVPPVSIPTDSILPGPTPVISAVCFSSFGKEIYL